jgi:hypothetical protein
MDCAQPRLSCISLFKQLEILPVPCQYNMFSLISFIINNQEIFQTNSSIFHINARNKQHLHRPNANLPCFQKSTFYAGINIFNILPPRVTIVKNDKAEFEAALRKYLNTHFFTL